MKPIRKNIQEIKIIDMIGALERPKKAMRFNLKK